MIYYTVTSIALGSWEAICCSSFFIKVGLFVVLTGPSICDKERGTGVRGKQNTVWRRTSLVTARYSNLLKRSLVPSSSLIYLYFTESFTLTTSDAKCLTLCYEMAFSNLCGSAEHSNLNFSHNCFPESIHSSCSV